MVYIHENWSLFGPKVVEKFKLKFWRSFNQKNVYLLRKIQTILNFKVKIYLLPRMWKYFARKNQSK